MATTRIDLDATAYVEILPASGSAYGTVGFHANPDVSFPDSVRIVESAAQPAVDESDFQPVGPGSVVYASTNLPKWARAANLVSNFTRDDG